MKLIMSIAFTLAACGGSSKKQDSTPQSSNSEAGEAKVVEQSTSSDVITLADGDRATAMEDAKKQMATKCGEGKYQITQEGEEAVGDKTAWRVHYQCAQ
jgi:hypothetical protein